MARDERDEELIPNTYRNAPGGFGKINRPSNYRQMRVMMDRIVRELKSEGVEAPTNEQVMKRYSQRMRAARGQ